MRIKRRTKRFFKRVLIAIPILLVCAAIYLVVRRPSTAHPAKGAVPMLTDRIERGQYLFTTLLDCDGCHSERDFSRLGGPVVVRGRGKGGPLRIAGLPGDFYAPNITPDKETGIGNWTDGEKIRAIREGISKDGHMLFPIMPYTGYKYLSDLDTMCLIAYMNSLPDVRNYVQRSSVSFLASVMVKGVPQPVTRAIPPVDPDGGEIYGEYLVSIAGCEECHTPQRMGQLEASMRFAGGRVFTTPDGTVVSSNITPDNSTGIGKWDFIHFRDRMHAMRQYRDTDPPKVGPERFTVMPWIAYSSLSDHDLEAIFLYIKAQKGIPNSVVPHPGHPEIKN